MYQSYNHAKGCNIWHLQWCTKYRYKIFKQEKLRIFCEVSIKECCAKNSIEAIELNVQPDHIHLVANLPRGMTDIKALQLLKGFTSFVLFRLVDGFAKRYPRRNLWSRGSFASTVGYTQLDIVVDYVKNQ